MSDNSKKARHRNNLIPPKQEELVPVQISVTALGHQVDVQGNAPPDVVIKALTMAINAIVRDLAKKAAGQEANKIHRVPTIIPVGRGN